MNVRIEGDVAIISKQTLIDFCRTEIDYIELSFEEFGKQAEDIARRKELLDLIAKIRQG